MSREGSRPILLQCMSPVLALRRHQTMSAIVPLLKDERTSRRDRESDVRDPKLPLNVVASSQGDRWFACSSPRSRPRVTHWSRKLAHMLDEALGQGTQGPML